MHHSLNKTLNKTILFWSLSLFALLAIAFAFTFQTLSNQPLENLLSSSVVWIILCVFLLLLLSIKTLLLALQRQLIQPLQQQLQAIEANSLDATNPAAKHETNDIVVAYKTLKHSHDDLQLQLSSIMQTLACCFWWSDDGKTYASISDKASKIINQAPAELQGHKLWAWTKGDALIADNQQRLAQAIEHQDKKLDIAYQVQRDDQLCWFGESITLSYDSDGNIDTVYGIISDINARKNRQQEQAIQLELLHRMETTGTLVGGIAHEFNNVLAGMNGNVFLIKQSTHDEQTLTRLKRIESLIERSAGMIDSMLSFAKKGNLKTDPISLVDFLNKTQLSILPVLEGNVRFNLTWHETANGNDCLILADKKKLQEVILQLVSNAKSALAGVSEAQINVHLKKVDADDQLLQRHPNLASRHLMYCSFQDNGCGIAENIQSRIFEPFFTTREVGQGTGLGLSMVYGYIQQLGGAIEVESKTDEGTTFHIYFPCNTAAQSESHSDELLLGDNEKILIVDDDKIFRESTSEVLQRMGYRTLQASSGAQGIKLFKKHQDAIRLIFMDILMPEMNGTQASKKIRKISASVPIIYLTGYDRTEPMDVEVYAEHAELINKPFRISTLSQMIQKVLKKPKPD